MNTFFLVSGYLFWGIMAIGGLLTVIDALTPLSTSKFEFRKHIG